nr:MAG TPA: hypothetical protein [Caudoviricetes sp.]
MRVHFKKICALSSGVSCKISANRCISPMVKANPPEASFR